MKNFRHESAKLLAGAADRIAQGVAGWSFEFWEGEFLGGD